MNFLAKIINIKFPQKRLPIIGEGRDGIVYNFTENKVLKVSKSKEFIDGKVLEDLNGLSSFPTLFEHGKKWCIVEKFNGISVVNSSLKPDWKEILLSDIEEAYKRGWRVEDLHLGNVLNVNGYIKILDVGRFIDVKAYHRKLECDLPWFELVFQNLLIGRFIYGI